MLCTDCVRCVCVWYVGSGASCLLLLLRLLLVVLVILPPPISRGAHLPAPSSPLPAPRTTSRANSARLAPARSIGDVLAQLGVFAHAGEAGPFEVVLDEGVLLIEHRIAL